MLLEGQGKRINRKTRQERKMLLLVKAEQHQGSLGEHTVTTTHSCFWGWLY